jgi:hypothetical protein
MAPWAKRLHDLIKSRNGGKVNETALARVVKASQPAVRQWFKPKDGKTTTMIDADLAVRAAAYAGTTVEYLMTGKGRDIASQSARLDAKKLARLIETVEMVTSGRKATSEWKANVVATLYADPGVSEDQSALKAALRGILNSMEA